MVRSYLRKTIRAGRSFTRFDYEHQSGPVGRETSKAVRRKAFQHRGRTNGTRAASLLLPMAYILHRARLDYSSEPTTPLSGRSRRRGDSPANRGNAGGNIVTDPLPENAFDLVHAGINAPSRAGCRPLTLDQ